MKMLKNNYKKYKKAKLNENATLLEGCSNTKVRNVDLLKNVEDLSAELRTLEENKNSSTQSMSKSNIKKINKSTSAREIFPLPPLKSNSSAKNKISQISENSLNEID